MAEAVHRSGMKLPGGVLALLVTALGISGLSGCILARETRQRALRSVVLDAETLRPLSHATLVVRADRGKGGLVTYHRYQADDEGRLGAPEVRGWTYVIGLPFPGNVVGEWGNEQTYLASGHTWLRVRINGRLRGRPPDRVLMNPLPAEAPRVDFEDAARRAWSGLDTWEIGLPACEGQAQGLREGDGRVIYWDPNRVIMAATVELTDNGIRFEDSLRLERVIVIEDGKTTKSRRIFLDARSCGLNSGK